MAIQDVNGAPIRSFYPSPTVLWASEQIDQIYVFITTNNLELISSEELP